MSAVDRILVQVEGLRQRGPHQWSARCPAHADKSPSLSIKESDSGALLLRCWAGCSLEAITAALGLRVADLFPRKPAPPGAGSPPSRWRLSAAQALEILARESLLVGCVAVAMHRRREIPEADFQRLQTAIARIGAVAEETRRLTR